MNLILNRLHYFNTYTIGKLYVDGTYFCDTLEDKNRDLNMDGKLDGPGEEKVQDKTCIPIGEYKIIINYSNRFKKNMPLLLNVPHFNGIRIHSGNTDKDTSGCILVGTYKSPGSLINSHDTFEKLFSKLQFAFNNKETINIEIL